MTNRVPHILAAVAASLALACGAKEEPPLGSAPIPPPPPIDSLTAAPPPAAAPAQAEAAPEAEGPQFEGEVDLRITSTKADEADQKTDQKADKKADPLLRLMVKGKRFRFTLPEGLDGGGPQLGPKGYLVIDGRDKKALMVSDEKRHVMVLPLDKLGQQMAKLGKDAAEDAPAADPKAAAKAPELKQTGKTDTVAGRTCEEWEITNDDKTKTRVCVASEEASWLELPTLGLPSEHAWARSLMDGKHLPLRAIAFEASGKEKGRVELVRLEKKALDDALFAAPAGYQVMDMGEMMRGMAQMMGGAPVGGAGSQTQGTVPPGMAGKLPPNFQAMMERMRDKVQAMKAQQAAQGADPERAEKLAKPAEGSEPPKASAKAKAKAKATQTAATKPAE
jgi:hypothetical protein